MTTAEAANEHVKTTHLIYFHVINHMLLEKKEKKKSGYGKDSYQMTFIF